MNNGFNWKVKSIILVIFPDNKSMSFFKRAYSLYNSIRYLLSAFLSERYFSGSKLSFMKDQKFPMRNIVIFF